jgi:secreted Zn-dependent insulinase-like peptidase
MTKERIFSKKIIDTLLDYYYDNHVQNIQIKIEEESNGYWILFSGSTSEIPQDLNELVAGLDTPRDSSLETYYEELLGEAHYEQIASSNLGSLIDESEISYAAPFFTIKVFRQTK